MKSGCITALFIIVTGWLGSLFIHSRDHHIDEGDALGFLIVGWITFPFMAAARIMNNIRGRS